MALTPVPAGADVGIRDIHAGLVDGLSKGIKLILQKS